ncbi:hypothetical protein VME0621_01233 [Vibrio mediterranei]|uniref:DUF4345 domain-containing protein n=1 Tax=Vibrio mediterranei TaxID=689 RepID=UPI0007819887|nr:DUF4345 domain-containing protein [Vibrio mediterranei]SBO09140.1 hypothetical protein VME0621_01233 [Vibrio mediterranei]
MTLEQTFLALTAVGLIPVALSYGASPFKMTKLLYKADINDNIAHIFRGIMGIYLAMITAWLLGTFSSTFTLPALFTLVFFMYGVAFGRIISFVQEKRVHALFYLYLILEIILGSIGLYLLVTQGR